MSARLLDAQRLAYILPELFEKHEEIYLASAWGTIGDVADSLLSYKHKVRTVVLGVSFCQTDPDLLEGLAGVKHAYVNHCKDRIFHPKLYFFRSGCRAEAIVGSSNLTNGGLGKNVEANVHIVGSTEDPIFEEIRDALKTYRRGSLPITEELVSIYRREVRRKKNRKKNDHPNLRMGKDASANLISRIERMSWVDFSIRVQSSGHHDYSARLKLLRECQRMFASVGSFADLTATEWKAIAGVIGSKQKHSAGLGDHDWAWFGSMKGAGAFAKLVSNRDQNLAHALDAVPPRGEIEKAHFEEFQAGFNRAFESSERKGKYATATRLLAMKRPDVFVCVSKPNLNGIAKDLGFAKNSLGLENYWEKVIEPIKASKWYNEPRPSSPEMELWDNRAAMLDAIFYDPE